jgi:chemotaxis protein MotB
MLRIEKRFWLAATALLIMGGCLPENEYLNKRTGVESLEPDVAALTAKNRQLQHTIENFIRVNDGLLAQQEKMKADYEKLVEEKRNIENKAEEFRTEAARTMEEARRQNVELAGDKQMLNESIALLKKSKEAAVEKVSGSYGSLLEKMEREIRQEQIAITELKGKLTVDVLDSILFDSGNAEIKPAGMEVLGRVVEILVKVRDKVIRVEGHTDNIPIGNTLSRQYPTNWELSAARALTVLRYLESHGIDSHELSAVAFGQYQPIANNDTPEGRRRNRRIVIVLQPHE